MISANETKAGSALTVVAVYFLCYIYIYMHNQMLLAMNLSLTYNLGLINTEISRLFFGRRQKERVISWLATFSRFVGPSITFEYRLIGIQLNV